MPTFRDNIHRGAKIPLIKSDDIQDSAIGTAQLSDGAVTSDKIANGAVTTDKLSDGAVKELSGVVSEVEAAESARAKAEQSRVDAEKARVEAESGRAKKAATLIKEFEPLALKMTAGINASTNATSACQAQTKECKEVTEHPTIIGANGYWWQWDAENDKYVDTGKKALGGILYPSFFQIRNKLVMVDNGSDAVSRVRKERNKLILIY